MATRGLLKSSCRRPDETKALLSAGEYQEYVGGRQ